MTELQLLLAQLVKVGLLALLLGMMLRGRAALCWSFTFYVVAIMLGNGLVTLSPERFFTPSFWVLKQGVYDLLKMATAIELAWRAFSAFPGAWRTARVVLATILVTSTLTLAWLTPRSSFDTFWEWQPSVATAAVWLLTAIAVLVVFYQIPIGDWQRAIVLGFAPLPAGVRDAAEPDEAPRLGRARRGLGARSARLSGARSVLGPRGLAARGAPALHRPDRRPTLRPRAPPDARARAVDGGLRGALLLARPLQPRDSRCSAGSSC